MRDRADPAIFDHSSKRHVAERQQASLQTSAMRKHVGSSTSDLVKTATALSNGGRLVRPYLSAAPRKRQMCDTICANPG